MKNPYVIGHVDVEKVNANMLCSGISSATGLRNERGRYLACERAAMRMEMRA